MFASFLRVASAMVGTFRASTVMDMGHEAGLWQTRERLNDVGERTQR